MLPPGDSYDEKQKGLGGNDNELSTKKGQLAEAKKQKASDEEFLDKLTGCSHILLQGG